MEIRNVIEQRGITVELVPGAQSKRSLKTTCRLSGLSAPTKRFWGGGSGGASLMQAALTTRRDNVIAGQMHLTFLQVVDAADRERFLRTWKTLPDYKRERNANNVET